MWNLVLFLSIFGIITVVFALAVYFPIRIVIPTKSHNPTAKAATPWRRRIYQHLWEPTKWAAVILAGIAGFLRALIQIGGGPPWPADPEIRPRDTTDGSSFVLPFALRNRSTLFDMKNVSMTCGIDLVAFVDANRELGWRRCRCLFYRGYFDAGELAQYNYPCDASALVQVRPDGSLTFRDTMSTAHRCFGPR